MVLGVWYGDWESIMATFDVVFEGGGAKGSAFVGALEALAEGGHRTERLIGTSAGAITATLLAAGFTPAEMLEAVNEKAADGRPRFAEFMDTPVGADFSDTQRAGSQFLRMLEGAEERSLFGFVRSAASRPLLDRLLLNPQFCQLFSFVERGGLYAGNKFLIWLEEKLAAKGIARGTTLAQMNTLKGCDLSMVVTDTSANEALVLNHRTSPEVPVAWAVRMSMSIPFVWQEVVWRQEWGRYLGEDIAGHVVVDGGVLSNFPLHLIGNQSPAVARIMGSEADPGRARNLGLLIDEAAEVPGAGEARRERRKLATLGRVERLIDTMTGARDNETIRDRAQEVCRLPAKGYGTTEFDMSPERTKALLDAARAAMRSYLQGLA
jgi:predicted acylesterase/phospholipase RssA